MKSEDSNQLTRQALCSEQHGHTEQSMDASTSKVVNSERFNSGNDSDNSCDNIRDSNSRSHSHHSRSNNNRSNIIALARAIVIVIQIKMW